MKPTSYRILVGPRKDCPYYLGTWPIGIDGEMSSNLDAGPIYEWDNPTEAEQTRRKSWEAYKRKHESRYRQAKIEKIY